MVEKLLQVWDWRFAVLGTGTSAFLTGMQTYMGLIALLLSICSATATILLTATKLMDWVEGKRILRDAAKQRKEDE